MADTTPGDDAEVRYPYESGDIAGPTIYLSTTPSPAPPARRNLRWLWTVVVSALVGAVIAVGVLTLVDTGTPAATTDPSAATTSTRPATVTTMAVIPTFSPADVADLVLPSIVTVEVASTAGEEFVTDASGSGVVIDADGLIATNHHVVSGAAAVRVVFAGGRIYPATVVGSDALTDLAVIRIESTGLTPVDFGSTAAMRIGDVAIAIGSPLGLEGGPSVTVGVVSAFGRTVRTGSSTELFGMLQTDAPITHGSSGGALVDARGRLIGITTAIAVGESGAEGLGFAIPVELVKRITADLIESGVATHAFLGISGTTRYETQGDGALAPAGVEVVSVVEGSAADTAGLRVGDTIVSFDGDPVLTMERLVVRIRLFRVGDRITVGITRDGTAMTLDIDLLQRPEGT